MRARDSFSSAASGDYQAQLRQVLAENRKILSESVSLTEFFAEQDSDFDESIHADLHPRKENVAPPLHFNTSPDFAMNVKLINQPPASKWLSLNDKLRSQGLASVVPNMSAEETVIDGSRLIDACSNLMRAKSNSSSTGEFSYMREKIRRLEQEVRDQQKKFSDAVAQAKQREALIYRLQRKSDQPPTRHATPPVTSRRSSPHSARDSAPISARRVVTESSPAPPSIRFVPELPLKENLEISRLSEELTLAQSTIRRHETERRTQSALHDQTVAKLHRQIEVLNGQLAEVSKKKWKDSDVKDLIRRDREAHATGLVGLINELPLGTFREIVQDLCVSTKIVNPGKLKDCVVDKLASLRSLERGMTAIHEGLGLGGRGASVDDVLREIQRRTEVSDRAAALEKSEDSIKEVLTRYGHTVTSDAPRTLELILKDATSRDSTRCAFEDANVTLNARDASDLMTKIVQTFMRQYSLVDARLVIPTMNMQFSKFQEMKNAWRSLCSEVDLDANASISRSLDEITRRLSRSAAN